MLTLKDFSLREMFSIFVNIIIGFALFIRKKEIIEGGHIREQKEKEKWEKWEKREDGNGDETLGRGEHERGERT